MACERKEIEITKVSATFDCKEYKKGSSLDLAGKPDKHELVVTAMDKAGNVHMVRANPIVVNDTKFQFLEQSKAPS